MAKQTKKRRADGSCGHPGNKHATKLKTPELKQQAYAQYCAHLALGKDKRNWYFEHPEISLTWETMEKYIKKDPEFDPIKKQIAWCKGYQRWEKIAEDMATGVDKNASVPGMQMIMRNKYDWDKTKGDDADKLREEESKTQLNQFFEHLEKPS